MTNTDDHPQLITPESVAAYVEGPPAECDQFDFLIGEWDAETTRYGPDGSILLQHHTDWVARHLPDKRMVVDETAAYLPDGTEIARIATLRTWVPVRERWEMTFLVAHEAPIASSFHGRRVGDEMILQALAEDTAGRRVEARVRFHAITHDSFKWEQRLRVEGRSEWIRDVTIDARRRGNKTPVDPMRA